MSRIDLTSYIEELQGMARSRAGASDFGALEYRDGLERLIHAFEDDRAVEQAGWRGFRESILDNLVGRLYAQHGIAEQPAVRSIAIRRPLVIVGLARTGTTALHRLLAQDPQFQTLAAWLAVRPMVRPPRASWAGIPEFVEFADKMTKIYDLSPSLRSIHLMHADEPEECHNVMEQTFVSWKWGVLYPSYGEWLSHQNMNSSYRYYFDVLRLIGAREHLKTWLLKDAFHLHDLDSLMSAAPDACLVQIHRDPVEAIPSWYSLLNTGRTAGSHSGQGNSLASRLCDFWVSSLERSRHVRQRYPDSFFDIEYRDFASEPVRTVRSIYERFSIPWTLEGERGIQSWAQANPTRRFGGHTYNLDSFGLSAEEIHSRLGDYRAEHRFH